MHITFTQCRVRSVLSVARFTRTRKPRHLVRARLFTRAVKGTLVDVTAAPPIVVQRVAVPARADDISNHVVAVVGAAAIVVGANVIWDEIDTISSSVKSCIYE